MNISQNLKPGIWGAVIGAAAITVVGFSSLGWKLDGTAQQMAADRADTAVVGVLTPICVEKFQHQANATAKLAELNKVSSWDREFDDRKGRLGNGAGKRHAEFGGCAGLRGTAGTTPVVLDNYKNRALRAQPLAKAELPAGASHFT